MRQTMVPTLMSFCNVDTRRIVPKIRAQDVQLPINAAVPCGLIINEPVCNVLKHAFPQNRGGEIEIDFRRAPGMQLLSLPTDQLGAEMSIEHAHPTQFSLRFSIG